MIGLRLHIILLLTCLGIQGQTYLEEDNFVFKNVTFDSKIKTIILQNEAKASQFPIINLGGAEKLTLRFDDLRNEVKDYSYTIVHCTPNWKKTDIPTNEYLQGYQEDNITEYTFSENTTQNFIHFSTTFPHENLKITKSGNYALVVYKDYNKDKIAFIQQFYVVENIVKITTTPSVPLDFDKKYTHHEIDFSVKYSGLNVTDVFGEFKTVVTQNNRPDNAINNLSPKFVNGKELIFNFDKENHFEAGNDFRTIDLRSLITKGQGVKNIGFIDSLNHFLLNTDEKRAFKRYSTLLDNNGDYFIGNDKKRNPHFASDYAWVHFTLKCAQPLDSGNVYVFGRFSNWGYSPKTKMTYNTKEKAYEAMIYLKQGVYDYSYLYLPDKTTKATLEEIEGNFFQTNNLYSIYIYHQQFSDNYSRLVGLNRFIYNR